MVRHCRLPFFIRFTLPASLLKLALSQSCEDVNICNAACISWETARSFCLSDPVGYDSVTSCLCLYPYKQISSSDLASNLDQCVVCNVDDVGPSSLAYYQFWTYICDTYAVSGEASAMELANTATTSVVDAFSSSLLPALSSSYCGAAPDSTTMTMSSDTTSSSVSSVTTDTTVSSVITTSTQSSDSSAINTSTSSSSARQITTTSTASPQPTSNSAARAELELMKKSIDSGNKLFLEVLCGFLSLLGGLL